MKESWGAVVVMGTCVVPYLVDSSWPPDCDVLTFFFSLFLFFFLFFEIVPSLMLFLFFLYNVPSLVLSSRFFYFSRVQMVGRYASNQRMVVPSLLLSRSTELQLIFFFKKRFLSIFFFNYK